MAIEKVREFFRQRNMEDRIREFDVSSATVELAAQAIGCEPNRIAKSLAFKVNDKAILVVASGDAKVDNLKYKAEFAVKAKMLTPDEAVELVGHAVGGICPFAIHDEVTVYLDISLKRFQTVFPACGSSNSVMELTLAELETFSNYSKWIDVCKAWQV